MLFLEDEKCPPFNSYENRKLTHVQGTLFPFCLSVLSAYDFLRVKMVTENSVLGQYGDKEIAIFNANFLNVQKI